MHKRVRGSVLARMNRRQGLDDNKRRLAAEARRLFGKRDEYFTRALSVERGNADGHVDALLDAAVSAEGGARLLEQAAR